MPQTPEEFAALLERDPDKLLRMATRQHEEDLKALEGFKKEKNVPESLIAPTRAVLEKNMEIIRLQIRAAKELNSAKVLALQAEQKAEEVRRATEKATQLKQRLQQVRQEQAQLEAEMKRYLQQKQ